MTWRFKWIIGTDVGKVILKMVIVMKRGVICFVYEYGVGLCNLNRARDITACELLYGYAMHINLV